MSAGKVHYSCVSRRVLLFSISCGQRKTWPLIDGANINCTSQASRHVNPWPREIHTALRTARDWLLCDCIAEAHEVSRNIVEHKWLPPGDETPEYIIFRISFSNATGKKICMDGPFIFQEPGPVGRVVRVVA